MRRLTLNGMVRLVRNRYVPKGVATLRAFFEAVKK